MDGEIIENLDNKKISAGEHVVELRVTSKDDKVSDWVKKAFIVYNYQDLAEYGMPGHPVPEGSIVTASSSYP